MNSSAQILAIRASGIRAWSGKETDAYDAINSCVARGRDPKTSLTGTCIKSAVDQGATLSLAP